MHINRNMKEVTLMSNSIFKEHSQSWYIRRPGTDIWHRTQSVNFNNFAIWQGWESMTEKEWQKHINTHSEILFKGL